MQEDPVTVTSFPTPASIPTQPLDNQGVASGKKAALTLSAGYTVTTRLVQHHVLLGGAGFLVGGV